MVLAHLTWKYKMKLVYAIIFTAFLATPAIADVPQQMNYNGYLTNAIGEPIDCPDALQCDEIFDITLRIYEASEEGVVLWEETHSATAIFNGLFSIILGSVNPITGELMNGTRWLAIKINDESEMSPRQKIASSAYSLRSSQSDQATLAENANQLGGLNAGDYATQETVVELQTTLAPVATEGLPDDLADGDDDTLGTMTCGVGMVPKVSSFGSWACANDEVGSDVVDTTLSEETVDSMTANNGYAAQTSLDALQIEVATTQTAITELQGNLATLSTSSESNSTEITTLQGLISNLQSTLNSAQTEITALQEALNLEESARSTADTDLQTQINTTQNELVVLDGSLSPIAKDGLPSDLADGDDDTLNALSCSDGQVAQKLGDSWACADQTSAKVGTAEPAPCDEAAKGSMYLDEATQTLRICDGTAYRKIKICDEICPDAATVLCNLPVEDSCGSACGGLGTALNPSLCPDTSTAQCGAPLVDECGNTCTTTGSATNSDQCATLESTTLCGIPITDNCGNACGTTGSFCTDTSLTCAGGTCLPFSQACTIKQAEHPTYTTIARDVALCGNRYATGDFDSTCAPGWSVCTLSQWNARFPPGVAPGGTLSSWGDPQSARMSGVWNAGAPSTAELWSCSANCNDGYNPWNNGKFLYNDAKSQILQGSGGCCDWDTTFSAGNSSNMAVYCCRN
jgi:hypothetical protein